MEEEFRNLVMKYVDVCDQLAATSELRKQKTELGKKIQEIMKTHDIATCNLRDGGKLVLAETKKVAPVKKEHVAEQLSQKVGPAVAEQVANDVWSNRTVSVCDTLKRVKAA
jgi:hypothetical protein